MGCLKFQESPTETDIKIFAIILSSLKREKFAKCRGVREKRSTIIMSLKIFYVSRIEDLAEKLVEELKVERKAKGPFEFLEVAVANPNLGNWTDGMA